MGASAGTRVPVLKLGPRPGTRREWLGQMWGERNVLRVLARADFQGRYKRTSFGLIWAVAVPLVQAVVLTLIFSRLARLSSAANFGAYVLAGVLCWSYFSTCCMTGTTAIVDGSGLTDKVWFPRAILVLVSPLTNVPGFLVGVAVLVVGLPLMGSGFGWRLVLLPLAILLLALFTAGLALVLSSLQVFYRDVRYLLQAALPVWFYLTPIAYPRQVLGKLGTLLDFNPFTGVATLMRMATIGSSDWARPLLVTLGCTAVLLIAGIELQRRNDRLFVDLL